MNRRGWLKTAAGLLVAAPAIVRASSLMPLGKVWTFNKPLVGAVLTMVQGEQLITVVVPVEFDGFGRNLPVQFSPTLAGKVVGLDVICDGVVISQPILTGYHLLPGDTFSVVGKLVGLVN